MFQEALVNPALLHPFYVIAILWRVHIFQRTASVAQVNLQMILAISTATRPWRTSENCRSIARNSTSNRHAVVYGHKAFRPRSWMSKRVQSWISGMTGDFLRLKRVQPAWVQQIQNPPAPQPVPCSQSQPASPSSASMVPIKPAPMIRNFSMASAPQNAPFPSMMGADPWAEAKIKQHRQ